MKEFFSNSCAHVVYFGDLKNQPYGEKTPQEIFNLSRKAVDFLLEKGVREVFIVCNTVSANALDDLRATFGIPIHGITDWLRYYTPPSKRVYVIGTPATIRSGLYQKALGAEGIETPELALLIEEGHWEDETVREYLQRVLPRGEYVLVLGCTHYPVLEPLIREIRPEVETVDPARILFENVRINDGRRKVDVFLTAENPLYPDFLKRLGLWDYVGGIDVLR